MRFVRKDSMVSTIKDHIEQYGGKVNLESIVLTSTEYGTLCNELGVTDGSLHFFDGIQIIMEEELLHGSNLHYCI